VDPIDPPRGAEPFDGTVDEAVQPLLDLGSRRVTWHLETPVIQVTLSRSSAEWVGMLCRQAVMDARLGNRTPAKLSLRLARSIVPARVCRGRSR